MVARDFTDGSSVRLCKKAWTVFFATMRKRGWDEKSARPHTVSETVFGEAIEETMVEIIKHFAESIGYCEECE
jgi:hypothetical protein